ncbi:response regulator [Desulfocicer vacuolatum]|nr:response regulator [Desulfocicer vacuolatum]
METKKTNAELEAENQMLRREIKVAREAAAITARLVVKQFEKTDQTLHHLEAANAQRRAVLDAATQLSIISTDLEGNITLFNSGATNLLGFSREEMVGTQNISAIHDKKELRQYAHVLTGVMPVEPVAIDIFAQHVKQQIFKTHEWTYVCKNGTLLPVNLSITPFYNVRGIMRGYLFTAMDMSRQKQMKQELIQAMESAESANASKGDFLARMSHEIRTPMNGIIGMAHLMANTSLNTTQKNYLDKIQTSARTLLNLINDILDFSKIDAGKLTLESIDFRLEEVMANLVNTIGFQAEDKGLEFLFRLDKKIPSRLKGDPLRLGQILMNLAGNAIKFTESGEIIISVTLEEHDDFDTTAMPGPGIKSPLEKEKHHEPSPCSLSQNSQVILKFSVKDSGVGLRSEQIDSLFDAFSQADDSITRKYGGTGLGLSICSQLTRMMGGNIWVESTPGEGSTFIFTVKLQYSQNRISSPATEQKRLLGHRALVVDDNRSARELLVSMLESFGMQVDSAPGGQRALDCLGQALKANMPYDVVLLDWIMPGMDGIETARRIKANGALAKTPAMLMVTANGRDEARMAAQKTGIKAFLLKPVYPSVMYNTLQETLGIPPMPHDISSRSPSKASFAASAQKNIRKAHILLVEDNAINQEVARIFLEDVGMQVDIAENGQTCLDMMEKKSYDLIFMDIQMPVLDGLETTRIIRNKKKLHQIPIIAMTAHAMAGDREKSLKAGMNGHLNKPVNPQKLYQILQHFIPKKTEHPPSRKNTSKSASPGINDGPTKENTPKSTHISQEEYPNSILDSIQGINLSKALENLGQKPELLLTILRDFKKNYGNHGNYLDELLKQKKFKKIRECAHTIKGISGYMAADELFHKASALENHLKRIEAESQTPPNNPSSPGVVDVSPVHGFIHEIEIMLKNLEQLPDKKRVICVNPSKEKKDTLGQTGRNISDMDEQSHSILKEFHALLLKGEFMAMDLAPDVEKILNEWGHGNLFREIMDLLDDIEFEQAADKMKQCIKKYPYAK